MSKTFKQVTELMCFLSTRKVTYRQVLQCLSNSAVLSLKFHSSEVSLRTRPPIQWFFLWRGHWQKQVEALHIFLDTRFLCFGEQSAWSKNCISFSRWVIKAVELWGKLCKFWPEDISLLIPWHMIRLVRTQHAFATAWSHVWIFRVWTHLGKAWQLACES